jgi:hypothetical protein
MTDFEIRGPIQPGSGPLQRLTAPESIGHIDDPLKQQFVAAAERTATNIAGIREDLSSIGWSVDTVADAVTSLESQLIPRFDAQVSYLGQQLSILQSIDASLKSPRRVAAAERIEQTADLLRSRMYDRALRYALDALEHDATNPGGFIAAGWALIGKGNVAGSIDYFVDASKVSRDYSSWFESMRQLAKCQLAIGDTHWARENLNRAINSQVRKIDEQRQHVSNIEESTNHYHLNAAIEILKSREFDLGVLHYEAAIATAFDGDYQAAADNMDSAVHIDLRFAQLAVGEPMLEKHTPVVAHALAVARQIEEEKLDEIKRQRQEEEEQRQRQLEEQQQPEQVAKRSAILRKVEGYNRALSSLYPWQFGNEPEWVKKIDEYRKQNIFAQVTRAKEVFSHIPEDEAEGKSTEELQYLLEQGWSFMVAAAQNWSQYQPPTFMGFGRIYYLERIHQVAQDILDRDASFRASQRRH